MIIIIFFNIFLLCIIIIPYTALQCQNTHFVSRFFSYIQKQIHVMRRKEKITQHCAGLKTHQKNDNFTHKTQNLAIYFFSDTHNSPCHPIYLFKINLATLPTVVLLVGEPRKAFFEHTQALWVDYLIKSEFKKSDDFSVT